MMSYGKGCRHTQANLIRKDQLDAVARKQLEVHLKHCDECREIADQFAVIETGPKTVTAISENYRNRLYTRLVPAINEMTAPPLKPAKRPIMKWSLALGATGLATAAVALLFVASLSKTQTALPEIADSTELVRETVQTPLSAIVDRCEGHVRIDNNRGGEFDRIQMVKNTRIDLEDSARFTFHIGELSRVALFGAAEWRLSAATSTYLEMHLDAGRLAVDFNSASSRILKVITPDSIVQVKGTIFTVEVLDSGETKVGVLKGNVEVVPRRGDVPTVSVGVGELVRVPGSTGPQLLTDAQRALAAELKNIDTDPDSNSRLVRFDGSPERVNVEVEGRVLGTTPLAMRLPAGPIAYTLTAPGMEPLNGVIDRDASEPVSFSMTPALNYKPAVQRPTEAPRGKRRFKTRRRAVTPDERRDWNFYKRARAAMTAGDIPFAIGLLKKAIKESSGAEFESSLALLAECYAAIGEYAKAADSFDRIIAMDPDAGIAQNARYEVGRLAMDRLNNYPRARAAFTAYLASRRGGALKEEAYYSLCELDSREGAHQNAAHCFTEFLNSFPDGHRAPDARLQRAAFYQEWEKRWKDADRDLMIFINAKPSHPRAEEARYRVILGRYQMGDENGALQMIGRYLNRHPNGRYNLRVKRIRQAIVSPTKASQDNSF